MPGLSNIDNALVGKRVYIRSNKEVKGRFGYVLSVHSLKRFAFVAVDGHMGSKEANERKIDLRDLIGVYGYLYTKLIYISLL